MPDPRIAILVHIDQQPTLAIAAVESTLRQKASFDYRVLAINDGCPYEETDRACRAYTAAYPERFRYLRLAHDGPCAARNSGIELVLRTWPSIEALLFLDTEDWLGPRALATAYQTLDAHPEASWVFPDIQQVGSIRHFSNRAGAWSTLELLDHDYTAHGSLIRREVFERGLRFDECLPIEVAAWDLMLRCAEAGLRGCHAPGVELVHYQGSLGTSSAGVEEPARTLLRQRLAARWTQRRILELEQEELPRFAIYLADRGRVVLSTDPCQQTKSFAIEDLADRLRRSLADPQQQRFPARFIITSSAFLQALSAGRCAAGLFWVAQQRLERSEADFVLIRLHQRRSTDYCLQFSASDEAIPPAEGIGLALLSTPMLQKCLEDTEGAWFRSLFTLQPQPRVERIDVRLGQPQPFTAAPKDILVRLADYLAAARPAYHAVPPRAPVPSQEAARVDGDGCLLTRRLLHRAALYPHLLDRSRCHVGFAMHVCDFGGSERVTLNLAREARRYGWAPHLFVAGSAVARLLREFVGVFESITVVDRWEDWYTDAMVGLLGSLDVVVAYNCWLFNEAMAPLRRLGVKTFTLLHSVGLVMQSRPHLVSFDTLRLLQDLDGVMVISQKLLRWCAAQGIPREKLVYLPNAPSFASSDALIDTTLIERAERPADQPLRVLFLGRFDPEKGMDRLLTLIGEARRRGLPFEWQVVGRRVHGNPSTTVDLGPIESLLRPPALSAAALSRYYRWADVVVMLSRLEGVPLTILEAQRFGCVVLSTNVGAVAEAIEPGQTGVLFNNDTDPAVLADAMLQTLQELQADRARLLAVARASAAQRREATWTQTFAAFARAVEAVLPVAGPSSLSPEPLAA